MKTADYYEHTDDGCLCTLCPRGCVIKEGGNGFCRTRGVVDNELMALGYGLLSSANLDPIEKKPLNRFHPGSMIFSIGGWGCNLACVFCQNWSISQDFHGQGRCYTPEDIVREALSCGSRGIAYTYNEPLINFEFVLDCSKEARGKGLANVLVTNGYINRGPAEELLPLIDALNIDIKSMDPSFYREHCKGELQPVLDFAAQAARAGCHLEITNLVIPGLNDEDILFERLAEWIGSTLGSDTALHLSAYHPQFKMKIEKTPVETLTRARDICSGNLNNIYLGNVPMRLNP